MRLCDESALSNTLDIINEQNMCEYAELIDYLRSTKGKYEEYMVAIREMDFFVTYLQSRKRLRLEKKKSFFKQC